MTIAGVGECIFTAADVEKMGGREAVDALRVAMAGGDSSVAESDD